MHPFPAHPLPAALETAVQRLKRAAREAAQHTVDALGLAALSALSPPQRERLLAAQFELNRKQAAFALAFNDALDERLIRDLGQPVPLHGSDAGTTEPQTEPQTPWPWDDLRLVDDGEVESQLLASRFAMDTAHQCEWELREIEAYLGSVMPGTVDGPSPNPLRPELLGQALVKAVQALSERAELQKLLMAELGRSLASMLRASYAAIVADWRQSGLRPTSLAVRRRRQPDLSGGPAMTTAHGNLGDTTGDSGLAATQRGGGEGTRAPHHPSRPAGHSTRSPGETLNRSGTGHSAYSRAGGAPPGFAHASSELGHVHPGMMSLIRRLAYSAVPPTLPGHAAAAGLLSRGSGPHDGGAVGPAAGASAGEPVHGVPGNLIHAHRDELRQAASGALDHLVIDVIGFLFDHILSDPKVPPQMARLLARLQLPVLRAALGDASFFAQRRHPVRRFVNRLAALSAAFDDITSAEGQAFLAKAGELVNDVVEGDFEQLRLYEDKLAALEAFVLQQQTESLDPSGREAAALVSQKEDELRLHRLYAQRLATDLSRVSAPPFVLDFLSNVWSQVLLAAQARDARSTPPGRWAARLRPVARELVLSVQPKATPAQRKALLGELPRLMQALTEGMDLVAWPADLRRQFFSQLMPAHSEALKATSSRQLDINLTLRQVDSALSRPPPTHVDLPAGMALPTLDDATLPMNFSDEEALRIGLVKESSMHGSGSGGGPIDIHVDDLQAGPGTSVQNATAVAATDAPAAVPPAATGAGETATNSDPEARPITLPGMPAWAEESAPATGLALATQVQLGSAYHMHLEGEWQRVRLSHVSAGRGFFIFTCGTRHQKTISLTQRMLRRLCEAQRFRAIETRTLLERAALRARQQLSALAATTLVQRNPNHPGSTTSTV